MRQIILQGLEQVYSKLLHMIAEFLPRFLVMLIIVLIGLLVALVLRYILRGFWASPNSIASPSSLAPRAFFAWPIFLP